MVGEQGFTVNSSAFLVMYQFSGAGMGLHSSYRRRQVSRCNRGLDTLLDSGLRRNDQNHTGTPPYWDNPLFFRIAPNLLFDFLPGVRILSQEALKRRR